MNVSFMNQFRVIDGTVLSNLKFKIHNKMLFPNFVCTSSVNMNQIRVLKKKNLCEKLDYRATFLHLFSTQILIFDTYF